MSRNVSNHTAYLAAAALLLLGLAAPVAHAARTFCCADAKGQQRCGDVLPEICRSRAYVEYNEAGVRVRNVAAPLTEAQQAALDAEQKKKREMAEAAEQQQRADQALLSTYAEEKDLDAARDRAVSELVRSIKSSEDKLVDLLKGKDKLIDETMFYKNKQLPAELKQKIARNQTAVSEQQAAIDEKKKELDETKVKFDSFRQRLRELKMKARDDKS